MEAEEPGAEGLGAEVELAVGCWLASGPRMMPSKSPEKHWSPARDGASDGGTGEAEVGAGGAPPSSCDDAGRLE